MSSYDETRLRRIADAANRALEIDWDTDWEHLRVDDVEALALVRLLEIIGEAARAMSPELRARHPAIRWRNMVDTRHRAVHTDLGVDLEAVRRIVESELPVLIDEVREVLRQKGPAS